MISLDDLDRILGWMQQAGLQSLSVTESEAQLTLKLAIGAPSRAAATFDVTTKSMGVFLPRHPRRPQSALKPGDIIAAGTIVGFLQSGQTLVPITTETLGRVMAIIAEPGALLGYGSPVLTLAQGG